jgi:hypothetical protein
MKRDKSGRFIKSKSKGGGKTTRSKLSRSLFTDAQYKKRQEIVKKINKLLPSYDKYRPRSTRRFVKDKKTGKYTTKEFRNKANDKKFVKIHNEIRALRMKIHSYPDPKLSIDKHGRIQNDETR